MLTNRYSFAVQDDHTTAVIHCYLKQLADASGNTSAEPIVRELLAKAVNRLHMLCASMLFRRYPRLMQGPVNLEPEEMLSALVERMLKALREVRPQGTRQFFALVNQHMRWELNDVARRLDNEARVYHVNESLVAATSESNTSQVSPNTRRILEAIEALPEEEREAFSLLRIQGMTQPEAAEVLGVSVRSVQRRLYRALALLTEKLSDLQAPTQQPPPGERASHGP